MNADFFYNTLGIAGMALFLIAYFLLQRGLVEPRAMPYLLLNLIGACLILFSLLHDWNLPAFLLESAWLLISLYGIIQHLRRKAP